ncbi:MULTISPECIES: cupredoxin domain-containing protein [Sutcliffiella]|uniref:EfeO-type cupredoxin-like domain-containing protein n=1 Tax=Sutcliffiella cohnii TaxID=33932 RepID=A0A223KVY3_9BACI|nr:MULTISPECIES: cupredoxin domain-containing protein [Sutcliffiella]AST93567.1 hypothetical protein BC6307_21000 [Sutcliffiella cohnii]WBL14756.1 cupredoxin domain-containing protein [Sutcliffiella sp. NC1]
MINSYTRFTATLLGLNVVTILIAGLFILRHFPPIHMINAILAGGIAIVLLCVKWKWVPVFGIIYGLFFSVLTIPSLVISMFRNVDPEYNAMLEASNPFIGISFLTAIFVLAILTFSIFSLKANIQQTNEAFSFFPLVKGAFYGATIIGLLISLYLQQHWVTGINATTIEKLPTIVMKPDSVEPATMELYASAPIVLRIQNESNNNCHILSFPELGASVHMEKGRTGLIVLDAKPGTYTYECKPHHDYYHEGIKGELTIRSR